MSSPPPEKHRYKLERPFHVRYKLQRALAEGESSFAQLARQYGVAAVSIREFAQRHKETIDQMKANLADEYVGMWIADKNERLQRYQNTAEILERQIEAVDQGQMSIKPSRDDDTVEDGEGGLIEDVSGPLSRLTRALNNTLKAVAEERGQLPTRMLVKAEEGGAVHVYGSGVDTDKV
ncbi:MAG: hypothetical protein ABW046_22610 [Actinoplanes sp.]